jgi:phosphate-selective porin OprO/OprP
MKAQYVFGWLFCAALNSVAADEALRIQELEKKLQDLDQKYRALERKFEDKGNGEKPQPRATPTVSIGSTGFIFSSADTNFVLRIRGEAQIDGHSYINDGGNNRNDRFLVRRARPIISGTLWQDFDYVFLPEFGGGNVSSDGTSTVGSGTILDLYGNYRFSPELQLRVGKFKSPVGLEQLQVDTYAWFVERGLPSDLTPNRDLGVMLHGKVLDGVLSYQAGLFNGVGDNQNSANVDFDDEKEFAGRLFFMPFKKLELAPLQGFGFGLGGSYGNQDGTSGLPLGTGFATEGAETFFSYYTATASSPLNVTADGTHWRLSPQGYWYWRSFGLMGEYVISSQEVGRTDAKFADRLQHTAWQIVGGYVLTGENASYEGVIPKNPISITDNHWGAFELVARYSELHLDPKTFPNFSSPKTSAGRAAASSIGLNWYMNRNLRTTIDYIHTDFRGGDGGLVTKQDENAILTRFQLAF